MVRIYRLTSTSTTTAVGQAQNTIYANGTIVGIRCTAAVESAQSGRISAEVALNNNVNGNSEIATGSASSDNLLTRMNIGTGTSGATGLNQQDFVPMDIPVKQGNILCINVLQTGTAPTRSLFGFDVMIRESR